MQFEVQVTGLNEARLWLDEFTRRLNDRHAGLFRAVNRVADVWKDNFDDEGRRVGRWAPLAESTVQRRASQGFGPEHPILQRSGALRNVVIDTFQSASGNHTETRGDAYSGQLTTSTIEVDSSGVARIEAHGWKVSNQYEAGGHEPRPFWFVDKTVLYAARSGVVDWLANDVIPG